MIERDLAIIGITIKDSPETTSSTEVAHPRETGMTTSVIQFKQFTTVILVSLLFMTMRQHKQKIDKSITNNFSDDKCNNTYRTSDWVPKTKIKKTEKNKPKGIWQLQIDSE